MPDKAVTVVREVASALSQWRKLGQSADVGMTLKELDEFDLAFEHPDLEDAKKLANE